MSRPINDLILMYRPTRPNSDWTLLLVQSFITFIRHYKNFEYFQYCFKQLQLLCFFMKNKQCESNKHVEFLIFTKKQFTKKYSKSLGSTQNSQNKNILAHILFEPEIYLIHILRESKYIRRSFNAFCVN